MIDELERDLETLRALAEHSGDDDARRAVERILRRLQPGQTVTTTEAAHLLGIRSINTLKALVVSQQVPYTRVGNRMMISLSEVLKLKDSQWVKYIRESSEADEEMGGSPLSQEELDGLSASRPGTLPWKRT
jgi:alkylated DNA nucleotide flippase Atl1